MNEVGILILLYGFGLLFLIADLFLPSHLLLTAIGVVSLGVAIALSFRHSAVAGWMGLASSAVLLPSLAMITVKYWRRTPIGRRTAPPNPTLTSGDIGVPLDALTALVGRHGTVVSPLRQVGICDFSGRRVSCIAEVGMIDSGVRVQAIGISGSNLIVAERAAGSVE